MDKLRPTIEIIKKHLFWILCGMAFLVTLTTYYMGSSSLQVKEDGGAKKIDANYKKVSGVKKAGDGFHPNEETHLELAKLTNSAKAELAKAWELKEESQRPLFVWPDEIGTAKAEFGNLRPIEQKVPFDEKEDNKEVKERDRAAYQDLVKNALPPLAARIGEVWLPEMGREGILESRKTAIKKAKRVVMWNEENQQYWEEKFTNFRNSYNTHPTGIPWTLQVLYAQEDMWILQSILEDIIKKTNGDAAANDLAKIKVIDHVFIGRDAQGIVGKVLVAGEEKDTRDADSSGPGGGGVPNMMEMMKSMTDVADGAGGGAAASPVKAEAKVGDGTNDPANGRYVDQNLEPVGGKTLRESFVNVTTETAYLSIAKRVPVRIGLQMDERAIWELMANCANARLPLEVKQVRMHVHEPGTKGTLAGKFADGAGKAAAQDVDEMSSGAAKGQLEEMAQKMRNAAGDGGESGTVTKNQAALGSYDVPVEIYGIIYLYNPVDPNVVKQIPVDGEESSDAPTAPSASVQPPVGRLRS